MHDIGKIGVPDAILNKPSRLSEMEFGLIKSHTIVGSDIPKNMIAVPGASKVAKYHHERFDGKGYPNGLCGTDIPLNARIVCIADAYDAMSSDRIYRKALSGNVIRNELINGRVAIIFIGQQIYEGIVVQDNISNMAHIVGGIVGAIIGYWLNRKPKYGYQ